MLNEMVEEPVAEPEFEPPSGGIASALDAERLAAISRQCIEGYEIDERSMEAWTEASDDGIKLAQLISEGRNYPWPSAANAMYPLIATAALQYNARAYPAICPPEGPVKYKVQGRDQAGKKAARAERAAEYHNAYLLRSDWEADTDRLTVTLPIVGGIFRKVWYDPVRGMQTRICKRLVINNNCADWDKMPRKSEEFGLYPSEIVERIASGWFMPFEWEALPSGDDEGSEHDPHYFIEQHTRYDIDGDGYPEPVIVTFHRESEQVVRIVPNFREEDVVAQGERVLRIAPRDYFVPYTFIPPFDGTFMGLGLGMLLGNTSHIINGIINQLIDSGHLASLGGGFIGAGLNLKGGPVRFTPGEWKPIPASGVAIRDNMVPLNLPGPSPVLFQLLGFLEEQARGLASINDAITGDIPRQQPATTTVAQIEQGLSVFTASYKRIFRAMRKEFSIQAEILSEVTPPEHYAMFFDEQVDPATDFGMADMDVQPVADPRAVTAMQQMGKAQLTMEMAQAGMVDPMEATKRILEAAAITGIEDLMPKPDPMQQAAQQAAQKAKELMDGLIIEKTEAEVEKIRAEGLEATAQAAERMDSIGAEGRLQMLDRYIRMLEVLNRAENDRQRFGGMAGQPGNAGSSPQPQAGGGGAAVPDIGSLLANGAGQPQTAPGPGTA